MEHGIKIIKETFTLFQDGVIEEYGIDKDRLNLKIRIPYLAELLDPSYYTFYLTLHRTESIEFRSAEGAPLSLDPVLVFKQPLDILSTNLSENSVQINCAVKLGTYSQEAREISICAESVAIYDEEFNRIRLSDLKRLHKEYWRGFPA